MAASSSSHPVSELVDLIARFNEGDRSVIDDLADVALPRIRPLAHAALERVAKRWGSRPQDGRTTALGNEVFEQIFLRDSASQAPGERHQFNAFMVTVAYRIARAYKVREISDKRGGKIHHAPAHDLQLTDPELTNCIAAVDEREDELIPLFRAMNRLKVLDEDAWMVAVLRYLMDSTIEQTADILDCAASTVKYRWARAKRFLLNEMNAHA